MGFIYLFGSRSNDREGRDSRYLEKFAREGVLKKKAACRSRQSWVKAEARHRMACAQWGLRGFLAAQWCRWAYGTVKTPNCRKCCNCVWEVVCSITMWKNNCRPSLEAEPLRLQCIAIVKSIREFAQPVSSWDESFNLSIVQTQMHCLCCPYIQAPWVPLWSHQSLHVGASSGLGRMSHRMTRLAKNPEETSWWGTVALVINYVRSHCKTVITGAEQCIPSMQQLRTIMHWA